MDVKCSNFLLVCFHISPQFVRLIPKQFWTYWGINLCSLVIVELQKKLLTKSCSMLSILTLTDIFVLKEEWCDKTKLHHMNNNEYLENISFSPSWIMQVFCALFNFSIHADAILFTSYKSILPFLQRRVLW